MIEELYTVFREELLRYCQTMAQDHAAAEDLVQETGVLSRMSREGLIILTGEEGRRKTYAITDAGKAACKLQPGSGLRWGRTGQICSGTGPAGPAASPGPPYRRKIFH